MGTRSGACNSYAPELVPIVYYRGKTRVQMVCILKWVVSKTMLTNNEKSTMNLLKYVKTVCTDVVHY